MPKEDPPYSTVQEYFYRWSHDGTWVRIHHALVMTARERAGREAGPTAGVIDSQSVKTTESGGPRGYDAGKKINGRKRHSITDVIARARAYDEKRASPSTFVALVAANRAALLGRRYYRQHGLFGRSPVSLDEPIADDDGAPLTRGELIAEADGYAAWMGQPCDPFLETEWRLDLRAVVQLLPDRLRGLCDALATTDTAKGARRKQKRSRADHYRCRREIGLRFRAAGLASPA